MISGVKLVIMPNDQEEQLKNILITEQNHPVNFEIEKKHEEEKNNTVEFSKEQPEQKVEKPKFQLPKSLRRQIVIPTRQDPQIQQIEKILEHDLGDAYSRLSPIAKQEFKLRGEEAAQKINELLKATHVKVKKILKLITEWLKLLPGINRFFLEQEAKIKTDQILSIKQKKL